MRLTYVANARLPTEKAHGLQIMKTCEALAKAGVSVTLLHTKRHQKDPRLAAAAPFAYYDVEPRFDVVTLPNWDIVPMGDRLPGPVYGPLYIAHAVWWARRAVSHSVALDSDVVMTRDIPVAYWLARSGVPFVLELHAMPRYAQRWLLRRVIARQPRAVYIALTSFLKERIEDLGASPDNTLVLPDAVDLSLFEDLSSKAQARADLGLASGAPIIGYVGRFQFLGAEKGIPDLIRALAKLRAKLGIAPQLLLVGGPMEPAVAYRQIAKESGLPDDALQIVDRVPNREVPKWLAALDIAAAPYPTTDHYAYYVSPMKLFEYMAAGAPIISTDLPAMREVLKHGSNAWLVRPDSVDALTLGLEALLLNPEFAATLGARARDDAARFTWDKRAATIIRVAESLLPVVGRQ